MAKKQKTAVLLPYDFLPIFEDLIRNGQAYVAAELTTAIIRYDRDGFAPEFTDSIVAFVWRTVIQPKLDENKEAYNETVKKRRAAGKQGGDAKAENRENQNVPNLPNGKFANENLPNLPNGSNSTKVTSIDVICNDVMCIDNNNNILKPLAQIEQDFETFWDEYPNRKGKGKAREAFKKAIKKTNLETMLSAIQKQKHGSQWTRDEGKYIPYPATWLNQERWDDEVDGGNGNGNATGQGFPPGMDDPTMRRLWEEEQRTAL